MLGCGPQDGPRNLLFITIDALRADHLSGYGYARNTSPHIDAFLRTAVTFEDAAANSSWTLGSLASMFTSTYSASHACEKMQSRLDDSFVTLSEILRDNGYRTAGIGSHTFLGSTYGLQQGFDWFDDELVYELANARASHKAITSPAVTDKALRWLDEQMGGDSASQPWFLWVHYFDPHSVYNAHEGISGRYGAKKAIDRYDAEITYTDLHVGRLLTRLDSLSLSDDTVVVLGADHGEEFSERGLTEHAKSVFREVTHIPLAIREPGRSPRRVAEPVQGVDLLPTLLQLLEIESDLRFEGRSLVPAMSGARLEPKAIISESSTVEGYEFSSITKGRWKLIQDHSGAVRQNRRGTLGLKPMDAPPRNRAARLLIDRIADPAETKDVSSEYPKVADALQAELEQILGEARRQRREVTIPLSKQQIENLRSLGYGE